VKEVWRAVKLFQQSTVNGPPCCVSTVILEGAVKWGLWFNNAGVSMAGLFLGGGFVHQHRLLNQESQGMKTRAAKSA